MRRELPVALRGFYGERYAKNPYTSLTLRLVVGLAVLCTFVLLLVPPKHDSAMYRWIEGLLLMALGGGLFLYLVVETWQTRRLIRFKGGPVIDFERSPRLYKAILLVFALGALAMVLEGASVAVG